MRDLLVLCYHALSPTWPAALSVTPDSFERQLDEISRRGYRGARFTDAVTEPARGRTVAVTFDDNYRSVLELAKPILDHYGYVGTLYVPTDWPEVDGPMHWAGIDQWLATEHEHELSSLSWGELCDLADSGWEIGSHTCSHPHLPELDDGTLAHELLASKMRMEEELKRPCTSIAYPYGSVDERVVAATGRAGYLTAGVIPRVLAAPTPLLWPRAAIFHEDELARFKMKISPTVRRLRRTSLGNALDRGRIGSTTF
jgi:peptidoglycan/xylan/chitin deacetylase (PgdA/CDA1 family)